MFSLTPAGIQVPSPSPINLGGKMVHLLEIFETTGGTCGVMGSPFFDACTSGGLAGTTSFFTRVSSLVHCKLPRRFEVGVPNSRSRSSGKEAAGKQAWTGSPASGSGTCLGPPVLLWVSRLRLNYSHRSPVSPASTMFFKSGSSTYEVMPGLCRKDWRHAVGEALLVRN